MHRTCRSSPFPYVYCMAQFVYRLWPKGGLWHWEVTAGPLRLGHGATLKQVQARAEATSYAFHPDRTHDIDVFERQTRVASRPIAENAHAQSEDRAQRAHRDV